MRTPTRRALAGFACLAALPALALLVSAGPLNPPAGPVAPTAKPLAEIEPRTAISLANTPGDADSLFKITQAGSYYLTGNITGVAGKHGIEIAASGVTIDLSGFDVAGIAGSFTGVIATAPNLSAITLTNGSVRNWGSAGIDLGTQFVVNTRIYSITASFNTGAGIIGGTNANIQSCSANNNGNYGIRALAGSRVSHCAAYQNVDGFNLATAAVVVDCNAYDNSANGYFASSGSLVRSCLASSNNIGITTGDGASVIDCSAASNAIDGIRCPTNCQVRGNTCFNSGTGAGIRVTGTDNRIEGNSCTSADVGIDVDVAGNFIARNTCASNASNYEIAANNKCLVVSGVNAAAISGNSGGVSPGSTDPNANYSY